MPNLRKQLQDAKTLVRLRKVQQAESSMKTAQAQRHLDDATEALEEAAAARQAADEDFRRECQRWDHIGAFEAALATRHEHAETTQRRREDVERRRREHASTLEDLRARETALCAAERLVQTHRASLRHSIEAHEQTSTNDLSVLKKHREP